MQDRFKGLLEDYKLPDVAHIKSARLRGAILYQFMSNMYVERLKIMAESYEPSTITYNLETEEIGNYNKSFKIETLSILLNLIKEQEQLLKDIIDCTEEEFKKKYKSEIIKTI